MVAAESNRKTWAKVGLIAAMTVGSFLMWTAIPIGWIWVGSRISGTTQGSIGPYLVVMAGIPLSIAVAAKLLGRLNRAYVRLTGQPAVRVTLPWLRSLRGDRDEAAPRSVLDVVMVATVAVALLLMAIWFFFFAGSSLPAG